MPSEKQNAKNINWSKVSSLRVKDAGSQVAKIRSHLHMLSSIRCKVGENIFFSFLVYICLNGLLTCYWLQCYLTDSIDELRSWATEELGSENNIPKCYFFKSTR